jgi:glycosyltransferase involved in cell wall biosynthesis
MPAKIVLQFSQLINRYDFMDVIVRHADPLKFSMMACTFTKKSNIQDPEYERDGFQHISFDLPFNKGGFFRAVFRLASLLKEKKVDLIHAHHYYEAFIARLALLMVPRCKLIITRHYHNELLLTTTGFKLRLYLFIERLVNNAAAVVISPSSQITSLLKEYGVDPRKIRNIPYGFDFRAPKYIVPPATAIARTKANLGMSDDQFLIGNFARHHTIKGQDMMLQSFAAIVSQIPDARLILIGDGPFHNELVKLAATLNIADKVKFLGWQHDVSQFLAAVDVVWHPTRQEAFPQIMIEAMALEKPLFITPVSGATDIVEDNHNGFIIPFNTPDEWTRRIVSLENKRDKLREIAVNAGMSVRKLDVRNIVKDMESVYSEVL